MNQLNTKTETEAAGEPIPVISKDLLAKVREDLAYIGQMGVDMGLFVDTMGDPTGRYKTAQKEKHKAEERILNLLR